MKRVIIKTGKWGCYFYDTLDEIPIDMHQALNVLNLYLHDDTKERLTNDKSTDNTGS